MKKLLLGTTVLASVSLLAGTAQAEGGIKLGLSGFMGIYFGAGTIDTDFADFNETGLYRDAEVHFVGKTTLDNGLTVGANVQLESLGSSPDQIDQNFGYVEGGFGRAEFGSRNTAAYNMQYAAPFVGAPINSGWVTVFIPQPPGHDGAFLSPGVSTFVDIGDDENTLTYFTPRLFGFQLGVSYQPSVVFSGDGKNFPVAADERAEFHDGVSIGVNFVESFGGVDIAIAGGYRRAEAPNGGTIVALTSTGLAGTNNTGILQTFAIDDIEQFSGGLNIGFGGFTIGGSVAIESSGRVTAATSTFGTASGVFALPAAVLAPAGSILGTTTALVTGDSFNSGARSTEGYSFDVGVTYGTGPWSFGVTYLEGVAEGDLTNGKDDFLHALEAGIAYQVGPGISASLSGMYASWDSENGIDSEGFVGIFGVSLEF